MRFLLSFIVILYFSLYSSAQARPIIIDTDSGTDDMMAILYLLSVPDIDVKSIIIEGNGCGHCKESVNNIRTMLTLMHQNTIPVACGRTTPLKGNNELPADIRAFCDVLKRAPIHVNGPLPKQTAKELLLSSLNSTKEPIDIVMLGPMTTLAEAIIEQPTIIQRIHRLYIMGGAVFVPGNIRVVDPKSSNNAAEWNIYIDPYAAELVLKSGIPATLVSLDVTNKVLIDEAFYAALEKNHQAPAAIFAYKLLTANKDMLLSKQWYFWDPMAAVIAIHPEIATCKEHRISVQLKAGDTEGATFVDKKRGKLIQVCTDIQADKLKELLLKTYSKKTTSK